MVGLAGLRLAGRMAAYDVTGGGRRIRGWNPTNDSINRIVQANGESLRRYARDAERRNPYAKQAVRSFAGNLIGTGIQPQSQHPDEKKRQLIDKTFLRWTDESDADGRHDFYGQQRLAAEEFFVAGEALARFRPRFLTDGLTVPLQIQLLPPEFLPLNERQDFSAGSKVRWGIEYNPIGKRIAYHLYKEHPGEEPLFSQPLELTRVPAEFVAHLYPGRSGQQRGDSMMSAALVTLYEIERYESAELVRKGLTALFAFFTRDIDGSGGATGLEGDEYDTDGTKLQAVEPGSVVHLPHGRTVEATAFPDVGGQYAAFLKQQLHKVAAALGVPYHLVTGDLGDFNYSSIRAALLEFRRLLELLQHQVMVYQFCRPLWRAWMDAAALAGVISPVDYARNRADYLAVEWVPDAWEWVDPEKDAKAEVLMIDNLLKSRSRVIRQMGNDPIQEDMDSAADQKREKEWDLKRGAKAELTQPTVDPAQNGGAKQ